MARRHLRAGFNEFTGVGLQLFTDQELEAIHTATLQVLRRTGVKIESEEALELFDGAGAQVTRYNGYGIVKIPDYLTEDAIRSAPRTGIYYGRRPEDDYMTDGNRTSFTAGFGEHVKIIDLETRQIRPTTKQDLADITRIQDSMDVISIVERAACSGDQLPESQSVHNYEAMVNNTSKHCFLGFNGGRNARKIIEIAKVAAGGEKEFQNRPIVTGFVCPSSPLTMVRECCESIIESARGGVGIASIPMSLSGASSPASLAGVVVQHNAEVLSSLILSQLARKGTPFTYCGCSTIMDLRLSTSPVGIPEMAILSAAWAKIAQYYQLPCLVGGCASDSKLADAQMAYDFSLTATTAALAGANMIFGLGAIDSVITFDYAAMITGAEQGERILKTMEGISLSDDDMVLDLIHEAGPGGEYMTKKHTFERCRSMSQAKLFDRRNRDNWLKTTGGKDLSERAYEKAKELIAKHEVFALEETRASEIRRIVDDYDRELKG
ncbi:[trimethylamine--corrinoid protein] Co-methyltransferase [Desulforhopalus singaporensis]|uniref:Trimethylamine---corrinoid protein Co-methyltransferase n=1 Tax=Desulforhopalus singaporensis TaxID=91360 RepID=A0A1H0TBW7_9BACT|nr:trimethylamine methyltransferase family protein [Desulforhopalus singaporensis]SDP51180.1 trimethylamine---corrinoid protein Co-methyltransferase [Desulforhopalus singaporensis]